MKSSRELALTLNLVHCFVTWVFRLIYHLTSSALVSKQLTEMLSVLISSILRYLYLQRSGYLALACWVWWALHVAAPDYYIL